MRLMIWSGVILLSAFFVGNGHVCAVTVPQVTVEKVTATEVEGTVSHAMGQTILLRSADQEALFDEVKVGDSGGPEPFKLELPKEEEPAADGNGKEGAETSGQEAAESDSAETVIADDQEKIELIVKAMPAPGVTASRAVAVEPPADQQTAGLGEAEDAETPEAAGETDSADPSATEASSSTESTEAPTEPEPTEAPAPAETEPAPTESPAPTEQAPTEATQPAAKPKTAAEGRAAAVAWARQIAADDRFTYGATPYSRPNGCYFCHTNGGKKKRAKKTKWANGYNGKTWSRTYCCNPFVHACYAHGAQHPRMLKACRNMNAIDMGKSSYKKMGCFKNLGKPSFSKLTAGDIFVGSNHVWLYCGGNELAEATSLGGKAKSWSADSIRVTGGAKKRYKKCRFVMRFTGY